MHTMSEIETALGRISGGRLLDVGTGNGLFAGWLVETLADVGEIVGVDARPWSEIAGDSIFDRADARFMQMDAHALEFDDASFDTVAIRHSLHHVADPVKVLAEMRRVLKPGGHLIIREMHRDDLTEEQRTHMLVHHWWAAVDRAEGVTHNETFTREELLAMIEGCALRDVRCFEYADLDADPFDAELINFLRERITSAAERVQTLPDGTALAAQAEGFARRVESVGFHSATVLLIVGRK